MKRLLIPMLFFSIGAVAQQPAIPNAQLGPGLKAARYNRYNAASLKKPYISDTLKGGLLPYLEMQRSRHFTVELSKIDHMPVVVPDKNTIAFTPNAWKDAKLADLEPMPNPALKPSK